MQKHNIMKRILSILLILLITLSMAGCEGYFTFPWDDPIIEEDNTETSTETNITPLTLRDPENAYIAAVASGYRGTFEEWLTEVLELSEYKSIFELMKDQGLFEGTLVDFYNSLKNVTNVTTAEEAAAKSVLSVVTIFSTESLQENATGSAGSGVIIEDDKENGVAYIITNFHVVTYTTTQSTRRGSTGTICKVNSHILVNFYGMPLASQRAEAIYLGGSSVYDIALLKVQSEYYKESICQPVESFGNSNDLRMGQQVLAIGNPENEGISVTSGIISVPFETITMSALDGSNTETEFKEIRIDASVNGGNSGGGLFDTSGNLIGIVNAKTVNEEIEGMCYAIPINFAIAIAKKIKDAYTTEPGKIYKGRFNIWTSVADSKPVYDQVTGKTTIVQEIQVAEEVVSESCCFEKLMLGDIIVSLEFDNISYPVINQSSIEEVLLKTNIGDVIKITFIRDGGPEQTVEVTLTENTEI